MDWNFIAGQFVIGLVIVVMTIATLEFFFDSKGFAFALKSIVVVAAATAVGFFCYWQLPLNTDGISFAVSLFDLIFVVLLLSLMLLDRTSTPDLLAGHGARLF